MQPRERIKQILAFAAAYVFVGAPALAGDPLDPLDQWPQWRGPLGCGVAPRGNPPLTWGENKNVRWKTAIPGQGHSTPVVWGDRIFITTAIPFGEPLTPRAAHPAGAHDNEPAVRQYEFVVLAVNRRCCYGS